MGGLNLSPDAWHCPWRSCKASSLPAQKTQAQRIQAAEAHLDRMDAHRLALASEITVMRLEFLAQLKKERDAEFAAAVALNDAIKAA